LVGVGGASVEQYQGYVEGEYVRVGLTAPGTLTALKVARGDRVETGRLLFTLDDTAERAAREEAIGRLQQTAAQVEDLLKGRRPPEIEQIVAQQAQADAALRLSTVELQRQELLLSTRASAQARVDEARAAYERDRARVAELAAQLNIAQMAGREDQIAAARAAKAMAHSSLQQAEWRLSQRSASAPSAALVADTLFVVGEYVPAGAPVVSLLPPANVKIRFFVPETKLGELAIGQRIAIGCDGCTDGIEAAITFVAPQAEFTPPVIYSQSARSKLVFMIEARPLQPSNRLHPGQPVDVRVVK
jgi:HlyD family secretion protein